MHSLDTIKKMNGEFPSPGLSASIPVKVLAELKAKADRWDAHVKELRSEPLRKNQ